MVSLSVAEIRAPDGSVYEREIVRHPGAAVIVPLDGQEVIMVRQYRPAVNRELLEIPAGKLDSQDEPPEMTAQRELEEEIGKRRGTWNCWPCSTILRAFATRSPTATWPPS